MANVTFVLNIASFAGVAILSVPTWSLNFRKKRLQRIRDVIDARSNREAGNVIDDVAAIVHGRRQAGAAQWRRIDEVCLAVGYLLLLGSSAIRIFY